MGSLRGVVTVFRGFGQEGEGWRDCRRDCRGVRRTVCFLREVERGARVTALVQGRREEEEVAVVLSWRESFLV